MALPPHSLHPTKNLSLLCITQGLLRLFFAFFCSLVDLRCSRWGGGCGDGCGARVWSGFVGFVVWGRACWSFGLKAEAPSPSE